TIARSIARYEPAVQATELPLTRTERGNYRATLSNVVVATGADTFTGLRIGFDTFRDEIMIATVNTEGWEVFGDRHYTELRLVLERRGFMPVGRELIRDAVAKVARDLTFDSAIK